jgi:hypothetical protein
MSTNTYTMTGWTEHVVAGGETEPRYSHAHATFDHEGVITGSATTDYLLYYDEASGNGGQRAPGYSRIEGSVAGRAGTFVVRHDVTYSDHGITDHFSVVPGSGTGELAGLTGTGTATSASETVPYTFDHRFAGRRSRTREATMLTIDRRQALAYRIAAHGLHRETDDATTLQVFDLGVQDDFQRGTAEVSMLARLATAAPIGLAEDPRFTLAWSHRGAPHYHRTADIRTLLRALPPWDAADAAARLSWQRRDVEAAGMPADEAVRTAARALRDVVGRTMTKGEASEAVTAAIPDGLSLWCRRCQATHIHDQLMRLATPLAGIALQPGTSPATLVPLRPRPPLATRPDPAAATDVVRAYLRLHGPATAGEAAGFVGTTKTVVTRTMWPDDLAEVSVAGRRGFVPADALALLENPPEPNPVRLLPPKDPLVQGRDRALLVPDPAHRKEVWKVLGNPGTILADGELAGTWRATRSGDRLEVTLTALRPLSRRTRTAVEAEADRVREVRGATTLRLRWA